MDIITTYSKEQQERCREYFEVIKVRNNTGFCTKRIAQITGVDKGRVKHWIYDKVRPVPVKIIGELEKKRLLPFSKDNPYFEIILDCFSFVFGDGHLDNNLIDFSSRYKKDLLILEKKLKLLGFNGRICKRILIDYIMYDGKILNGKSYSLRVGSSSFARLLIALGAPKGNKTNIPMNLPEWLLESSIKIKSRFLGVLYGNEGTTPTLIGRYNSISRLRLKFVKNIKLKDDHEKFLNQLSELFKELGISISKINWEKKLIKRKDGNITQPAYVDIDNNFVNFLKFYNTIPILYNSSKSRELRKVADTITNKIRNYIENCKNYHEMLKLIRSGTNLNQISLKLGVNYKTLQYWKNGGKPLIYKQRDSLAAFL